MVSTLLVQWKDQQVSVISTSVWAMVVVGIPQNNAQRDDTLLGKMLRLDPSLEARPAPPFYTMPPDNPMAAAGVPLGTIWAKGLRNPWRFAFDPVGGDLYIADVGQNSWEEVHFTPPGRLGAELRLAPHGGAVLFQSTEQL